MKSIFLSFIFLSLSYIIVAQNPCNQPISNFNFQQKKREIQNQFSESQKLLSSKQFVENNCVSSLQVKEIAVLFTDDYSRLDFAKTAFPRVFDRNNFYEVYNAFQNFSTVFMLHDFVLEWRRNNAGLNNNHANNSNLNFPNLIYPNHIGYNGVKKCDNPLNDNDFYTLAWDVNSQQNENDKINRLSQIIFNNCLTTAQTMKFATLLGNENTRLDFLKGAAGRIFDVNNYSQAVQVLNSQLIQQNFLSYIGTGNTMDNNWGLCTISAQEFNDIKSRIAREKFNNTKLSLAKTILRTKKCFATQQVRDLVKLFPFASDQLDLAKFAYDFTTDTQNYYTLTDAFTFDSDKEALIKFIESKSR
jgi:hypothetical protein